MEIWPQIYVIVWMIIGITISVILNGEYKPKREQKYNAISTIMYWMTWILILWCGKFFTILGW